MNIHNFKATVNFISRDVDFNILMGQFYIFLHAP